MSENSIVKRTPNLEETAENINLIIEEISHGNNSIIEIQNGLKLKDVVWDYNKVKRYHSAALKVLDREKTLKQAIDQRHILLKRTEGLAASEWNTIDYLMKTRNNALSQINNGVDFDNLNFEQKEVLTMPLDRFFGTLTKCKQLILQSVNSQSELLGFKQDKTILIQHQKSEKLQYMDELNDNLLKKYRNNFDMISEEMTEEESLVITNETNGSYEESVLEELLNDE
jgi:hypothetical protein